MKRVPHMRFPEFRDAGEWDKKPLGKIVKFSSGGTPSKAEPAYWDGDIPWISASSMHETEIMDSDLKVTDLAIGNGTRLAPKSSLLILVRGSMLFKRVPIGIALRDVAFNQDVKAMAIKEGVDCKFLLYQLIAASSKIPINETGIGAGKIETEILENISIFLPKPVEQQVVADLFFSLDTLIAAQAEKLDALKQHKKGLMQQLFPRGGETVPRLRFPEFQDAGDWEENTLGQCLSRHPEYGINAPSVPYAENLPTYLRITDISDAGQIRQDQKVSVAKDVTDENYLKEGDIVFARTGASVGKAYKYRTKDGRFVFAGFLIRVRTDEQKLNSEFLFQFLFTEQYWRWVTFSSARSGQPGINSNEYASLPLQLPPQLEEQQKIADCFSSLDALIVAQGEKIDALKQHKKGLMQKLFPTKMGESL